MGTLMIMGFFQSLRLVKAAEPSAGDYFEIIDSLDLWSLS